LAYFSWINCRECGESKEVVCSAGMSDPIICGDCQNKIEKDKKKKHFEELDKLSLEERIRKIEENLYHNSISGYSRCSCNDRY